jgi:hypothetical protein
MPRHVIEARLLPVKPAVNTGGYGAWQAAHLADPPVRASDGLGDAMVGRSTAIGGMVHVTAFAVQKFVD